MPTSSAARVLSRYLSAASPRRKTAAVVLTDSPPGWDWGWFGNVDPPLTIVPMHRDHQHLGRVILEDGAGRRVFRPEGRIPTDVLIELAQEVDLHDLTIEDAWCREAAIRGWIEPGIDALGGRLMVLVYGGTSHERIRGFDVNWRRIIGQRKPVQDDVVIDAEHSVLLIGAREARPIRLPLRHVVFQTKGAVLDGVPIIEPDYSRDQWVNSTP